MAESLLQRQEEEWEVLQAVYMEDAVDLRKKVAWKVERPLHVCLSLKQQQSESVAGKTDGDSMIDLVVKCSSKYPEIIPEISLENAKGLSNEQIAVLNEELNKQAQSLVGEVMILELAQYVQTFLRDNYKGPQKSFYEEMLNNQRKQQEKQVLEQQKRLEFLKRKEEKERQLLEDEIQKRHEALKEETKKRKEAKLLNVEKQIEQEKVLPSTPIEVPSCSPIGTPDTPRRPRISQSPSPLIVNQNHDAKYNHDKKRRRTSTPRRDSESSDHICKDHTGGIVVIAFNTKTERTIHRGTCLGHSVHGSTVYAGIDTTSGELVAISEWVLKWRHMSKKRVQRADYEDKEGAVYLKQVTSVEQEIHSLIRLRHTNLIHYLAIKYVQDPGKCTVYILMEYSGGASLNIHITEPRPLSVDIIKSYTEEILSGLEYLHNKDVVHKNLRASSVFVDKNGRIRLGDYSIDKRLSDLYFTVESSRPGVHFNREQEIPAGRGGKKGDIYQLGLLLLSVAQGVIADANKPEIPTTLPAVFQDFLTKCLMKDERHRWSVNQLLDHSFIKEALPHTIHYLPHKPAVTEEADKKAESNKDNDSEDDDLADLPFITALEASGQSRLTNEFEVLRSLGKGGFGDVIEVRNKLDRRKYAIKRIPLNPKSKYFNKKITREVKLLSRLNHENVVRYYNSWIETSEDPAHSDSSSSTSATTGTGKTTTTSDSSFMKNSLNITDDIEKFAPQARDVSVEWSMSYNTTGVQKIDDSSDSEDEADVFGSSFFGKMETSDDIMFEHSSSDKSDEEESDINKSCKISEPVPVAKLQYLYIQMEFCERSTLRNCIDAGLYLDMNRLWRLFREIVEGLVHIHEQGMIHRDLKPVNIFLDSNDHVKIGDFGLATTSVLASQTNIDTTMFNTNLQELHGEAASKSMSRSDGADDLTGKVGTALYVSPEMMTGDSKMSYSQKVDMYSLGVIFFEMCYRPLPTGMERVQILGNLRQKEIIFPEDYDQMEMENQTKILKMLMNHDPSQRPTSAELLKSEYMPPPQLEEAEQNEILRSTIADPTSKAYKRLINGLFSQTMTPADDHLFDSDFHKGCIQIKMALTNELVYESLIRIFQKHGAVPVSCPLLMPKNSVYENNADNYPCFMDHSGLLVGLPFDLRAPFARYVARNNIINLRRYCIEKVYRTKRFHKQHPRELTECAFDIVSSSQGSLIPDAEILIVVQEIINEFPALQKKGYYVKMNHVTLLKAILMHSGVTEELFDPVLIALSGPNINSKTHHKTLENLGLTEQVIASLLNFLEMEEPLGKISSILRCITKTKGEAATLAKQGLHELETVMDHSAKMGFKLQMVVSLGFLYSVHQYSGVTFQVMCDHRKKNRNIPDVLAVGGRYNDLISKFHSPLTHSFSQQYSITQNAVGVSIHFEKIVSALLENPEYQCNSRCDILVCAIGHKPMLKDRMAIMKDLWAAGLKAELLLDTVQTQEDIQDMCRSAGISHIVLIKDGEVKVRSIEKEKITEKKITSDQLTEFLMQKIQSNKIEQNELKSQSGQCNSISSQSHSESIYSQSNHSNMTLTFTFIMAEGKLSLSARKKYEPQIYFKVTSCLSWLPGKSIDVIAVELTAPVIKTIAAYLEMTGTKKDFDVSISSIVEKQPRHRKYLNLICDQIFELKFERKTNNDKGCDFIVLYGLKDDSVKLLS